MRHKWDAQKGFGFWCKIVYGIDPWFSIFSSFQKRNERSNIPADRQKERQTIEIEKPRSSIQ